MTESSSNFGQLQRGSTSGKSSGPASKYSTRRLDNNSTRNRRHNRRYYRSPFFIEWLRKPSLKVEALQNDPMARSLVGLGAEDKPDYTMQIIHDSYQLCMNHSFILFAGKRRENHHLF
jgi:hypothetical protein